MYAWATYNNIKIHNIQANNIRENTAFQIQWAISTRVSVVK
jgi:hypothetical protein